MSLIVPIIVSLAEAGAGLAALYIIKKKINGSTSTEPQDLGIKLTEREDVSKTLEELSAELRPMAELTTRLLKVKSLRDDLKADRGRVSITYAELETLEGRLRELHEIERELKASSLETKEELKILQNKELELKEKNNSLKQQLDGYLEKLANVSDEIEISSQMSLRIDKMKADIASCQSTTDQLLLQIEEGNLLYIKMKRRYDALDIEYAQLYEKFSDSQLKT